TDGDLADAKDVLAGELRVLLSFFDYSEDRGYYHRGIWTGSGDNYAAGDGNQNAAAAYSILALQKIYNEKPELFTSAEEEELNGWVAMLDKMWPTAYYNTWFNTSVGGYFVPTAITPDASMDSFAGVFPMMFAWYNIYPYTIDEMALTAIGYYEGNNFDYFFNSAWDAFLAARAGYADMAYDFARYVLNPTCLYDDSYFCENAADGEDFKRSPETGAHGAYLMALSAMLFDGENDDRITVFPAITDEWQKTGVSFGKFLANGNIEVSANFTEGRTTVVLTTTSAKTVSRDIYVRLGKGSGAGVYNGTEYELTNGYFVCIPVTLNAGETLEMEVTGIEKQNEIEDFYPIFPIDGADGIRFENVIFNWSRSENATSYELVISENEDLSNPVYDIDMGQSTLYYPALTKDYIVLGEGVTYYWTAIAHNGENTKTMEGGTSSFTTK
ncbi:MAG: hypothetical protein MJ072_04780, partial [Clostridia bacterium]|nr:hypothetical protein [Clostridia bacterium]